MKFSKLVQGLMAAIAICVSATALHAQGYSVFAMGTGSSLFDKNYYSVSSGPYGSTYKTGGGFTVGAEVPLKGIFGVEGSYSLVRNNLEQTYYGTNPAVESGYGIRNQRVSGDLVAHSPKAFLGIKPYLAAGLEYDRYTPLETGSLSFGSFNGYGNVALNPANKLGFNYGGGLDFKLTKRIALRVDARDHVTGSPTYGLSSSPSGTGPLFPISGVAHNLEYSAGVVFRFGK